MPNRELPRLWGELFEKAGGARSPSLIGSRHFLSKQHPWRILIQSLLHTLCSYIRGQCLRRIHEYEQITQIKLF